MNHVPFAAGQGRMLPRREVMRERFRCWASRAGRVVAPMRRPDPRSRGSKKTGETASREARTGKPPAGSFAFDFPRFNGLSGTLDAAFNSEKVSGCRPVGSISKQAGKCRSRDRHNFFRLTAACVPSRNNPDAVSDHSTS
jgi:hypothetical protein